MDIGSIFTHRMNDVLYNTSYPLNPEHWKPFRVDGELNYSGCHLLSFYIHIPFCEHLCNFCEYTRTLVPDREIQQRYLECVMRDIDSFLDTYPQITLCGFDIGGGTPTSLCDECFEYLLDLYKKVVRRVNLAEDFEPSIEATFQTLSAHKARQISEAGIKRISLGIQSSVKSVQYSNGRKNHGLQMMTDIIRTIHSNGIEKVNVDLMYGLKGQNLEDTDHDLACIAQLSPEQVTLYELRTNMICCKEESTKEELFSCYSHLFDGLTKLGFHARFGQNTFTKNPLDKGLSSYLRHRMLEFIPYKGFGLSAQNLAPNGISYNIGKGSRFLHQLIKHSSNYPSSDTYLLPRREMLSKFIAISAYYGQISITVASKILGMDFITSFTPQVDFCKQQGLMEIEGDNLMITKKGFKHYGAVFSLFFNDTSK